MSQKYSNSPALVLRIGNSRQRRYCFTALSLPLLMASLALWNAGYPWLALLATPPGLCWLARRSREPLQGRALCWNAGRWSLRDAAGEQSLDTVRGFWVGRIVCLRWRYPGQRCYRELLLFGDSATAAELRQLRRRLRLEG